MTNEELKKHLWRNTISNYSWIGVRMAVGLVMFRLLYKGLPTEEFGFWSLLWSVFGYGILLDFGFGFTAVKRVAELSVHGDWDQLSRVLSTIFYLYVAIALVIIAAVLLFSHQLIGLFRITSGNVESFRDILVWFFCGMAISFPLGIFPEILMGQQRMALVNTIFAGSVLANFALTALGLYWGWSLKALVIIALGSAIVPSAVSAVYALRALPRVKIRPGLFSPSMIRETLQFSVFAYIATVSNIILGKTDQIVISTTLAVSAVALYQAGAKLAEMFGAFIQQLPDVFSPAAAHLHAKGDKEFLMKLLVDGTRFSVMIATPAFLIGAFYMEGILQILTGGREVPRETFWVGEVLLLWQYVTVVTQSVSKRIFMMCGHERRLMKLGVGEALMNLVLSVGLVLYFKNVLCVAIGSLIATAFFGWIYLWPWAAAEVRLNGWTLARRVLLPTWLACVPLILFLVLGRLTPVLDFKTNRVVLIAECVVALIVGCVGVWKRALTPAEKQQLTLRFSKLLFRGRTV